MKETDQLRNLMEAIDSDRYGYDWGEVHVYDSYEGEIYDVDLSNELERARFDRKYGFDTDSLFDFPVERGVRHFTLHNANPPRDVIVSPDIQAISAEVESRS